MIDYVIPPDLGSYRMQGLPFPEEFVEQVVRRYRAELETRLAVALAAGMRLAVRPLQVEQMGFMHRLPTDSEVRQMTWEFVMLAPGESPPLPGPWTIYEFRGDQAVGRSA